MKNLIASALCVVVIFYMAHDISGIVRPWQDIAISQVPLKALLTPLWFIWFLGLLANAWRQR